nr:retrotransposon protein, putative, Ty3-gypsy subclass [Tanacetum cinerariifolium]
MRQRCWLELLKDYDVNIQYHPRKANMVADALSRKNSGTMGCLKIQPEIIKDLEIMEVELVVHGSEDYIASLKIEPNLILQIKEAQKEDDELWSEVQNIKKGKQEEFWVDEHGVIWYGNRLCVPGVSSLQESILSEEHSSPFSIHPGSTKIKGTQLASWQRSFSKRLFGYMILKDMLRSCALEWTGNWDEYLCLVEFAYNNSWHASFKGAPFGILYGRKCRAPICWNEVGERVIESLELVKVTNKKVSIAKEKLKEARSRQKSYADRHRRALELKPGDRVFLNVSPCRGYNYHHYHVVQYLFDKIHEDLSFAEEPEAILDRQDRDNRLVVPNDASLREALLTETHSSSFSVHPGSTKMYHDLKQHFWWSGMKRDVATFISRCLIYQQVKIEHQWASGLLQPLNIPVWKWDEISMDFVTGLTQTQRRHDAI